MFIIEVLKALMRRLLIAGKRMIKALPDEIRDRNKGLLITKRDRRRARLLLAATPGFPGPVPSCSLRLTSAPITGDLCQVGYADLGAGFGHLDLLFPGW